MVKSRSVKRNVKNARGLLAQAIGILEDIKFLSMSGKKVLFSWKLCNIEV